MLSSFEELRENIAAVGGELTAQEDQGLKRFAGCIGGHVCRLCGACERANPGGVAVSDILRFSGYYIGYGQPAIAKSLYAALPKYARVESAKDLNIYEKMCPYNLPVAKLLRKARRLLA